MDHYRARLKKAAWGWMESHRWLQGKFKKDRVSGRADKRGGKNDERQERDVVGSTFERRAMVALEKAGREECPK